MANDEAQLGALYLGTVGVKRTEEAGRAVDVGFAVGNVPPHELTGPAIRGVVSHAAALTGAGERCKNLHYIGVEDYRVGVRSSLVSRADVPHDTARGVGGSIREHASPDATGKGVARRKLHSVELEAAID